MRFGLILSAGRGERFGYPKQKVMLGGHPLALWSILAFEQSPAVDLIVMVTDEDSVEFFEHETRKRCIEKIEAVVPGGTERIDSLHAGLKALPKEGFVAVHDAARPFVRAEEITEGFKVVKTKGSAIYAIPVTDTIKCVEDDVVLETVPRDCLYRAQTPQFFGLPILRQALAKAEAEGFIGTDEASYVERLGEKIHILPGREENIKITFPQDLELAENLLAAGTCP
ncbi:MAG: 2-C-methyl-D-erythritol 4-phosphate cytidylyltransferase [candidate division WOR-3 bacterium]|nr:2-C-methyl-D-erythritol 4-phosphate cytidylyltransferase [candidate division WOR-3 bacterium]